MRKIEVLDTGLVYRNPMPHLRSRHAYFASAVELPDGTLAVAMDIGSAFEAVDVRSFLCTSKDGAATWTAPKQIFEPVGDVPTSTTCRISRTPGGGIVGLACLFGRSRADRGLGNPEKEGFVETDLMLVRSDDGGATWSVPTPFSGALNWRHYETCSPFVCLSETRWLAPCALWPNWDGENPHGNHAIAFVSDDGGKTFPRWATVFDDWKNRVASWETKITRLSDGRVLGVCWAFDYKKKKNGRNRYVLSNDQGESFSRWMETPLQGETCGIVGLDDNLVLCAYRRIDKPGLWAHLARLDGDTWTPLAETLLWGGNVKAHDESSDSMLEQMSSLRFGFPNLIRRANGEVFLVFWCVEECVSNIRWFRLNVS
ncbi:MAG: exo-alpha-sialidase [Phycisphaerae bacterium]|nr:exo-alpha-sialidase [Phycisphaerae bacterium]